MTPHVGKVVRGQHCYLHPTDFPERGYRRRWLWRGAMRSAEWREGGIVKNWGTATDGPFTDHQTEVSMTALLEECAARGVERPSGYGDLFHKTCRFAPTQAHVRKMFPSVPGAWEHVIQRGTISEPLFQYDMRSAYLWSYSQGLPAPSSFATVNRIEGPGLYWVESPADRALPYPWSRAGVFPATFEEITTFDLRTRPVTRGIAYVPNSEPLGQSIQSLRAWSCWKNVARAFWGRWASIGKVECVTYATDDVERTRREMADSTRNPVWGAIITSRVRLRCWEIVWRQPVARVYVDSVVTTAPIEESDDIGGWKLIKHFPNGGYIGLAGVETGQARRAA
jgi:hypothetical protein